MDRSESPSKIVRVLLTLGLTVILLTIHSSPARSAALLYATDSNCDCLYTIGPDGKVTVIGVLAQDPGESFVVPTDMAADLDGTLYVLNTTFPDTRLLKVDRVTGDATVVGVTQSAEAIAFNPVDVPGPDGTVWPRGTLFARAQGGLVVLDKSTGATISVIHQVPVRIVGMSFRSDGVLFGVELIRPGPARLFRISTISGSITTIGYLGPVFGASGAAQFDGDDNLWVSDIDHPNLLKVDVETAQTLCSIPLIPGRKPQGMAFASDLGFPSDCSPTLAVTIDIDPNVINLSSHAPYVTTYIESSIFGPEEIDVSSLRLAGSVPAVNKFAIVSDHDSDGIPDLTVKFSRAALDPLLTLGANELSLGGSLVSGEHLTGKDTIRVIQPQGAALFASIAPNPLNPSGVLTFTTSKRGPVKVAVFDTHGRLVRVLLNEADLPSGTHTARFDGVGMDGRALASGMYFYRVEGAEGSVGGRIIVAK